METDWIDYREAVARAAGLLCLGDAPLKERLEMAYGEVEGLDGADLPADVAALWREMLLDRTTDSDQKPGRRRPVAAMTEQGARVAAGRFLSLWRQLDLLTLG